MRSVVKALFYLEDVSPLDKCVLLFPTDKRRLIVLSSPISPNPGLGNIDNASPHASYAVANLFVFNTVLDRRFGAWGNSDVLAFERTLVSSIYDIHPRQSRRR